MPNTMTITDEIMQKTCTTIQRMMGKDLRCGGVFVNHWNIVEAWYSQSVDSSNFEPNRYEFR